MSTHCARSTENTPVSHGISAQGAHSEPFLWNPIPCSPRPCGAGIVGRPQHKEMPFSHLERGVNQKSTKTSAQLGINQELLPNTTPKLPLKVKKQIFSEFIFQFHATSPLITHGQDPACQDVTKRYQTDATREIFNSPRATRNNGDRYTSEEPPEHLGDTSPKQVPSP